MKKFIEACAKSNIDHDQVADRANVDLTEVTVGDMSKLRVAFKQIGANK